MLVVGRVSLFLFPKLMTSSSYTKLEAAERCQHVVESRIAASRDTKESLSEVHPRKFSMDAKHDDSEEVFQSKYGCFGYLVFVYLC